MLPLRTEGRSRRPDAALRPDRSAALAVGSGAASHRPRRGDRRRWGRSAAVGADGGVAGGAADQRTGGNPGRQAHLPAAAGRRAGPDPRHLLVGVAATAQDPHFSFRPGTVRLRRAERRAARGDRHLRRPPDWRRFTTACRWCCPPRRRQPGPTAPCRSRRPRRCCGPMPDRSPLPPNPPPKATCSLGDQDIRCSLGDRDIRCSLGDQDIRCSLSDGDARAGTAPAREPSRPGDPCDGWRRLPPPRPGWRRP